ncbi:MAG: DNA-3-methyladenine glycosylase 2 family protein [Planctomycetes bacterium]|nr:DNA-3-methyladenine glycosylase 2 family protein [Planctomycetota bacterium]
MDYLHAQRHLKRRDHVLKSLIQRIGPCTLRHDSNGFRVLAQAIVSQQISTKAARAIAARLVRSLGRGGLRPRAVLAASDESLRTVGLSRTKALSLRDLAEKFLSGAVPLKKLSEMPDEDVIEALLPVRGVGRWTAEMFLIFSLGRLDVLPVADYGLRAGVHKQYELEELPDKDTVTQIGEAWRPYRSIGTWFIWRSFGEVRQSKGKATRDS